MPAEIERIIKKLKEQKRKEGKLPQVLEFYNKLVEIQSRVGKRVSVPSPSFSNEEVEARAEEGRPLTVFSDLVLDRRLLGETFKEVAAIFSEYPELFGEIPEQFKGSAVEQFITQDMVKAWFEGTELPVGVITSDDNKELIKDIIHASMKPFLASYAAVLLEMVNQEKWRRGYCPICGGNPDFGFLDKERGSRWLVCSRCDAEWLFQRLQCPYCGTTNQNDLAYFTDDEGLYRLYICEQCKHYLKAIDLRQTKSEVLVPLERLYTLDLDKQAQEKGYSPCE